ncbi:SspB family protein [Halocynthiibacter namhaensis]|uniref:SspB family protein n=1 Tax=Halocynthiibacter namhaensis TaxID=1290553 RepID=UPI00057933E6|nr:ClpXP protease specificity-enhancing factor SspB [Halocynthiibacter namhaensis]
MSDSTDNDTIEYGILMHDALRVLIKTVLTDVSERGLPGDHHFFITFDTTHPDVQIAEWLQDRYPGEMTIVVQHWFENLEVGDEGFAITLNFGEQPEPLYIPWDALVTFVDPSVEFGLRFETHQEDDDPDPEDDEIPEAPMEENAQDDDTPHEAEVVSLDAFRK